MFFFVFFLLAASLCGFTYYNIIFFSDFKIWKVAAFTEFTRKILNVNGTTMMFGIAVLLAKANTRSFSTYCALAQHTH